MSIWKKLFGHKKDENTKTLSNETVSEKFDDFYTDNNRIEQNHFCRIETTNNLKEITQQEIITNVFDISLLQDKLDEWKVLRKNSGLEYKKIDEVFNDLLVGGFLNQNLIEKFDEIVEMKFHLSPINTLFKILLHYCALSINYEAEIDCLVHPYDFESHFNENILPILKSVGMHEIKLQYKFEEIGDGSDFKYIIIIGNIKTYRKIEIYSDCDFYNPIYYLLNQILIDYKSDFRFVDLESASKILMKPKSFHYLKNKYSLPLRK